MVKITYCTKENQIKQPVFFTNLISSNFTNNAAIFQIPVV